MSNYVEGKVIIVTGGANGFGKLVSKKLSAMGAKVVCADINETLLQETVNEIQEAGNEVLGVATDITKRDQVMSMVAKAKETYGRVDVLVNNAGTMPIAYFADHEKAWKQWDLCFDVSLKGTVYCMSAVYDIMMAQGEGHVVNISSVAGNLPMAGLGVYAVAKKGVEYLAHALRIESHGKIKTTVLKPSAVPGTGLTNTFINPEAVVGGFGHNAMDYFSAFQEYDARPDLQDSNNMAYLSLNPDELSDYIVFVINQPQGIQVSDITLRSSNDMIVY